MFRKTSSADKILTSRDLDGRWPWLPKDEVVGSGLVLRTAAITGRPPTDITGRLRALGYRTADTPPDDAVHRDDKLLLSALLNGESSWLDVGDPVDLGHIIAAAVLTDRTPPQIAERLTTLGHTLPGHPVPATAEHHDPALISRDHDGRWPWLPFDELVDAGRILRSAAVTGRTPTDITERLRALGYRTADTPPDDAVHRDDKLLLSALLNGESSWLDVGDPVDLGHIIAAAVLTDRTPPQIAERLTTLGHTLPDHPVPATAEHHDPALISRDHDGRWPWLPFDDPVPHLHITKAATATGLTPATVKARLTTLGYPTG